MGGGGEEITRVRRHNFTIENIGALYIHVYTGLERFVLEYLLLNGYDIGLLQYSMNIGLVLVLLT